MDTNQPIKHYPVLEKWRHLTALAAGRFRRCWESENDSKKSSETQANLDNVIKFRLAEVSNINAAKGKVSQQVSELLVPDWQKERGI